MKIIHRYVLKETLPSFLFGFLFFNFILFVGIVFDLTKLIFVENAPLLKIFQLIFFSLPSFFDIVIPVALLFSILLSFGRLSADGEITALRSSGVSLFQVEVPVILFAVILTCISLFFSAFLTPWCNLKYKAIYREILLKRPQLQIKEKTLVNLDEKRIYTFSVDKKMGEMKNIVLFDFPSSQNQKFPQLLIAEKGKAKEEEIYLEGVRFYRANPDYRLSFYGECQTQTIYLHHEETFVKELKKASWDMTFNEIREMLKKEKLSPQERRKLETDLQGRIAIPLATVILGILAVPLGVKVERGEKSISLGISLIIVVVYYIFFLAGNFLSQAEILSPFLGIWIANFALFSVAIFLNIQMVRK